MLHDTPSRRPIDDFAFDAEVVDLPRPSGVGLHSRAPQGSVESGLVRAWRPYVPGQWIAEKYRVERLLGQADLLCVVQATHLVLKQPVILKYLLPEARAFPEVIAEFLQSARFLLQLRSEHVAPVLDVGMLELGTPYLALERPDGFLLSQVTRIRGPLPVGEAVDTVRQIATGLAPAHALGRPHAALGLGSVVLTKRADGSPLAKIFDWGGGTLASFTTGLSQGSEPFDGVSESLRCLAPEHARTPGALDERADVWSLGAILHELLTGVPAFTSDTVPGLLAAIAADAPIPVRALRPDLPEWIERFVLRCLQKDRELRLRNVSELLVALAAEHLPEQAPGPASTRGSRPSIARSSGAPGSSGVPKFYGTPVFSEAPRFSGALGFSVPPSLASELGLVSLEPAVGTRSRPSSSLVLAALVAVGSALVTGVALDATDPFERREGASASSGLEPRVDEAPVRVLPAPEVAAPPITAAEPAATTVPPPPAAPPPAAPPPAAPPPAAPPPAAPPPAAPPPAAPPPAARLSVPPRPTLAPLAQSSGSEKPRVLPVGPVARSKSEGDPASPVVPVNAPAADTARDPFGAF